MAKKSKTQKAKASAARAQKKLQQDDDSLQKQQQNSVEQESKEKKIKIPFLNKDESSEEVQKKVPKKEEKKPAKKSRLQFFKDVQAELRRVTWPSRQDVIRWSGVVLAALVFFGLYIFVLDNGVVTPLLVAISGFGG
ncbi:MAG: preprotein translocase subunit SecE [Raoultibacter sp.]|jgi:preprotein translocase subunit SecE